MRRAMNPSERLWTPAVDALLDETELRLLATAAAHPALRRSLIHREDALRLFRRRVHRGVIERWLFDALEACEGGGRPDERVYALSELLDDTAHLPPVVDAWHDDLATLVAAREVACLGRGSLRLLQAVMEWDADVGSTRRVLALAHMVVGS
jgi:hypothetical protein